MRNVIKILSGNINKMRTQSHSCALLYLFSSTYTKKSDEN